jgi:hypothetical protein
LRDGATVLERHVVNGNSGKGIVVVEPEGGELAIAPLYTYYIRKKSEWRVHIFQGSVVDVQRKARRKDVPDDQINWKVRNYDNGFIFARGEEMGEVPRSVIWAATNAMAALDLDFGAVDVIYNEKNKSAYALEVNSAPGLQGETLSGYVRRFQRFGGREVGGFDEFAVPEPIIRIPDRFAELKGGYRPPAFDIDYERAREYVEQFKAHVVMERGH